MKLTIFIKSNYRLWATVCFLLITATSFAQPTSPGGGPCDGDDGGPDGCPLDTWVIVLVIIAVAFAATHLYRQKKSLQA